MSGRYPGSEIGSTAIRLGPGKSLLFLYKKILLPTRTAVKELMVFSKSEVSPQICAKPREFLTD